MKEENKVPLTELRDRLHAKMQYEDPDHAIDTLFSGWIKHPEFISPNRTTIYKRNTKDGYIWLKQEEIPSFAAYCGCELTEES